MGKKIIVKQNDLIDNFIFNATESELQILNYAVAVTNPTWENKNLVYRIDIPELVEIYKTKSKNTYTLYRDALARLMKREISFWCNDRDELVTENIIIQYRQNPNDNSYLKFKFNEFVSTRIAKLEGLFTQYDIKHIAGFKSRYAFLLYEYFKMKLGQIQEYPKIYKKTFLVDELKQKLDISDKYKVFAKLELGVLQPAQKNINKHSDIHISYKVKRKGRTPIAIVFTAKYQSKKQQIEEQKNNINDVDLTSATIENNEQKKQKHTPEEYKKIATGTLANIKKNLK